MQPACSAFIRGYQAGMRAAAKLVYSRMKTGAVDARTSFALEADELIRKAANAMKQNVQAHTRAGAETIAETTDSQTKNEL